MALSSKEARLTRLAAEMNKALGAGTAGTALGTHQEPAYIPTGSLALDFALGGGWPRGHISGVFGPRDIGKSSIVGLNAIASVQKQGGNAALICVEPGFDPVWAAKHGVDPEDLFITRPNSGEKAFEALYTLVTYDDPKFDLIMFDSIGAILAESEIGGKKGDGDGKMKAGGQAGLITWGIKRVVMPVWKQQNVVIMLNQVRDNMASPYGGQQQPGGHALEHSESVIVQLKRGPDTEAVKVDGEEVQVMQQIKAVVLRNKLKEGYKTTATFNFYNKEVEGKPFGIDKLSDLIATGKRTNVIEQSGPYYKLPGVDEKFLGKAGVETYLKDHPEKYEEIREAILEVI